MYVANRVRLLLARRPWLYWTAVAAVAGMIAWGVHERTSAADDARRAWVDTSTVVVAIRPHAPGDELAVATEELPVDAVPDEALTVADLDGIDRPIARQHLAAGEPVTWLDVRPGDGPAALADPGSVTVALTGQHGARTGLPVAVAADGLVVAEAGRIVAVDGDVVFVAVERLDGATVAAAVAAGSATLLYLP